MNDTLRLTFLQTKTNEDLDELWQNCFAGQDNLNHINKFVPFLITHQWQLNSFLTNEIGYNSWIVKRIAEKDIIGFAIHGNFYPGRPNNIGFNIGLNYTRKGYATETLKALIEFVRGEGLHETFGHCYENNIASIKTMENCGFINGGRTGTQYNNGNYELKFTIQL